MGCDPVGQIPGPGGFGAGVVACVQHRHEDGGRPAISRAPQQTRRYRHPEDCRIQPERVYIPEAQHCKTGQHEAESTTLTTNGLIRPYLTGLWRTHMFVRFGWNILRYRIVFPIHEQNRSQFLRRL
jgi:hypothetical protein